MAEAVVDGLEVVEIREQNRRDLGGAAAACERLRDPIHEQRAIWETGQRIVKREVRHRVCDARVGQRNARMHRERDQHLLLGQAVCPATTVRGHRQCPDDRAVLLDRSGHRSLKTLVTERLEAVPAGLVVLDNDRAGPR